MTSLNATCKLSEYAAANVHTRKAPGLLCSRPQTWPLPTCSKQRPGSQPSMPPPACRALAFRQAADPAAPPAHAPPAPRRCPPPQPACPPRSPPLPAQPALLASAPPPPAPLLAAGRRPQSPAAKRQAQTGQHLSLASPSQSPFKQGLQCQGGPERFTLAWVSYASRSSCSRHNTSSIACCATGD